MWPATLKDQALAFYRGSRAVDAVAAASTAGWLVEPRPHLAFFRASVGQRLYLTPRVDALTYERLAAPRGGAHLRLAMRFSHE